MRTRPPALPGHARRVRGIDAGRVLATFGIVWVHTSEIQGVDANWAALGRFGTSFYIVSAVLMSARPFFFGRQPARLGVLLRRGQRLLVPYLLWCALYGAFYLGTMMPRGATFSDIARYWGPLSGTAPHLWFLPFAFVVSVLCIGLMPWLLRQKHSLLVTLMLSVPLGSYLISYSILPELDREALTRLRLVRLGRFIEELPLALSSIVGVALYGSLLFRLETMGRRKRRRLALFCGVGFACVQLAYFFLLEPLRTVFWTEIRVFANLAGAFFLVACVAERNNPLIRRIAPFGSATYFAFLAHQLVLDLSKKTLSGLPGHGSLLFALLSSAAIFALSFALGWLAPRLRPLRWLVP